MASVRDSSQQDRRVYVGNLSYDVKWHHLKDFMRQGTSIAYELLIILLMGSKPAKCFSQTYYYFRMECRRWAYDIAGFPGSFFCLNFLMDNGLTDGLLSG